MTCLDSVLGLVLVAWYFAGASYVRVSFVTLVGKSGIFVRVILVANVCLCMFFVQLT